MKNEPLVTIITAVLNGEKYLEETIQSVLNQSYQHIQYIIIDGGSTDSTVNIIKQYNDKIDFWISESDSGIYDAWNKALKYSEGDWVSFIGAGDLFFNNAISTYVEQIKGDIEFICSRNLFVNSELTPIKSSGSAWTWRKMRKGMPISHVGSLHKISLFERLGYFDPSYKVAGDQEFLLRAGKNLKTAFIDKHLAQIRIDGVSYRSECGAYESYRAKMKHVPEMMMFHISEYYFKIIVLFVMKKVLKIW